METEDKPAALETESPSSPVIIDLGKKRRKAVRKLRKGKPGKLLNKVEETMDMLRAEGAIGATAQPVIIVVRERAKRDALWKGIR